MHPIISAVLGSGMLCGSISFHIATKHFEIVAPLTEWLLKRDSFTFLFYAVSASIGIVFLTAGRRGSEVDEHVRTYGNSVTTFYASASGSVLGWAIGLCFAAVLENPARYWILAALVISMTAFVVAAPIVGIIVTRQMVESFNSRWFRQRWREPYIRMIGGVMLAQAIVFLIYDLRT